MHDANDQLQFDAVRWIDAASELLRGSDWGSSLRVGDVDVLDAVRTPLLLAMLQKARGESAGSAASARRAWETLRTIGYRSRQAWHQRRARRESPLPAPATVLFWPQMMTHVRQHVPVAERLRSLAVSTGFVVNRPETFEAVRRSEPNVAFATRAWRGQAAAAKERGVEATQISARDPQVKLPPFRGWASPQAAVDVLRRVLAWALPEVWQAAALAEAALAEVAPEVLVVGNDITLEGRTQCLIAAARGVRTVSPMHGMVSGEPLQGKHRADAVFVHGERSRRDLIALGEDPAKIHVCGDAHLAVRQRQTHQVHPQIAEFLQLSAGQPWILLATSGPGHSVSVEHHLAVIEAVMRASEALPRVRFVAKLHPKDRVEYYRRAKRNVPHSRMAIFQPKSTAAPRSFSQWLQGCTGVITGGSTAGLDALLADVPVISIDLAGELWSVSFVEGGATQHVREESELLPAIQRVVSGDAQLAAVRARAEAFLQESFFALDGDPALVAAKTILALRPAGPRTGMPAPRPAHRG